MPAAAFGSLELVLGGCPVFGPGRVSEGQFQTLSAILADPSISRRGSAPQGGPGPALDVPPLMLIWFVFWGRSLLLEGVGRLRKCGVSPPSPSPFVTCSSIKRASLELPLRMALMGTLCPGSPVPSPGWVQAPGEGGLQAHLGEECALGVKGSSYLGLLVGGLGFSPLP